MSMMPNPAKRSPARMLVSVLAVLSPLAFMLSIPWLREQPDGIVYLFAGIAATITILCSFALAVNEDRKMDEWHRSASRFASQWGWLTGGGVVAILLALPPVQGVIVHAGGVLAGVREPDGRLVLLAFTLGFMAVIVAQMFMTLALGLIWRRRMSRAG